MGKGRLAASLAVLLLLLATTTSAQMGLTRYKPLTIMSGAGRATTDSSLVSLGAAATVDTTRHFSIVVPQSGVDSLSYLFVIIEFTNTLAAGESVYVALDGSNNGRNWSNLNSANIGINGFSSGSVIGGAVVGGRVCFNAAQNSTTNVAGTRPGITPTQMYGSWWGFPTLRVRIRTGAAMIANSYRLKAIFPSVND